MIDLHIKDKCLVCPCPELQIEKLVYRTCAGKTDAHIHIFCQNEEKCEEIQEVKKMDELIPCPFCGGTKIWIGTIAECEMQDKNHPDYEFNSQHYTAVCDYSEGGCGASTGGSARTVEEAIKAWNGRVDK